MTTFEHALETIYTEYDTWKESHGLECNKENIATINLIYEIFSNNKKEMKNLSKILNEHGRLAAKENPAAVTTMHNILQPYKNKISRKNLIQLGSTLVRFSSKNSKLQSFYNAILFFTVFLSQDDLQLR